VKHVVEKCRSIWMSHDWYFEKKTSDDYTQSKRKRERGRERRRLYFIIYRV